MSLFSGIKDASVSKSGQYFKPGHYKVKIKAVKMTKSQAAPSQMFFIIETEVLESDNPDISPGSERSQVIDMSNVMALPNVKAFVAAASGVEPTSETVNEEVEKYWSDLMGEHISFDVLCDRLVSDSNPLEGLEMFLECINIVTKKEKKDFTKHMWSRREV